MKQTFFVIQNARHNSLEKLQKYLLSYLIRKKYQFLAKEKLINRATQKNAKIKRISSFPQSSLLNKIGRVHLKKKAKFCLSYSKLKYSMKLNPQNSNSTKLQLEKKPEKSYYSIQNQKYLSKI